MSIGKKYIFKVRMHDVQEGLGVENISDLVRKKIHGIFETNNPTKNQNRKYKRSGKEWINDDIYTYVRSDLILKLIMHCRGYKKKRKKRRKSS